MSDTGTISQELINKVAEELATLRREREELRQALQWLLDARSRTATEVIAADNNARTVLAKNKRTFYERSN